MTWQPLYATLNDGMGVRSTHSQHGLVNKIKIWVNSRMGEIMDGYIEFEDVEDDSPEIWGRIGLDVDEAHIEELTNGKKLLVFKVKRPLIDAKLQKADLIDKKTNER